MPAASAVRRSPRFASSAKSVRRCSVADLLVVGLERLPRWACRQWQVFVIALPLSQSESADRAIPPTGENPPEERVALWLGDRQRVSRRRRPARAW